MAENVGPLLLRAGLITEEQFRAAIASKQAHGGTVPEHLVLAGAIDEEALCEFFRLRLLIPRVSRVELLRVGRKILGRVPAEMAVEFRTVPLEVDREGALVVAMQDPADTHAVDEIAFFSGTTVLRTVAAPSAIAWALHHHHGVATPLCAPQAPVPTEVAEKEATLPRRKKPPALIVEEPASTAPVVEVDVPASPEGGRGRARGKKKALIVDDGYGDATPLPPPVPFDQTGPVSRIDAPEETITQRIHRVDLAETPPPVTEPPPLAPASEPGLRPAVPQTSSDADDALVAVLEALRIASDRDAVAEALVAYLSLLCRRAAFFVVRKGTLAGWVGAGPGVDFEALKAAGLSLDRPSLFRDVVQNRIAYRGPLDDAPSRDFVIEALGWAPENLLLLPVSVRQRVVGVLYGDDLEHHVPDEHLAHVSRAAGEALERALLARK